MSLTGTKIDGRPIRIDKSDKKSSGGAGGAGGRGGFGGNRGGFGGNRGGGFRQQRDEAPQHNSNQTFEFD